MEWTPLLLETPDSALVTRLSYHTDHVTGLVSDREPVILATWTVCRKLISHDKHKMKKGFKFLIFIMDPEQLVNIASALEL